MTSRTILIVDDDDDLRSTLVEQLSLYEEFDVLQEATAAKGISAARTGLIDLLIMDVGLPDMDGREAVKMLRKGGYKAPIIMLTGHDTDSDTILGLEAGANDFSGTLMEESISKAAGADYGESVLPGELRSLIRSIGRVPAERYTTYDIRKVFAKPDADERLPVERLQKRPAPVGVGY